VPSADTCFTGANQGQMYVLELPHFVTIILRMQADHILLLDSFFYMVIFHGTTVASWRKNEYHLQPEHAAFAELLTVSTSKSWPLAS